MTTRIQSLIAAWAICFLALAFYVMTLYQTVPGGDSGELITVAHIWGVAHPPGYPLYTLIAHFFTLFPFQSLAWRVNFLSAVCDALAAGFLTSAVIGAARNIFPRGREHIGLWAGIFCGALFAFSPEVWKYATQAEVFPLNNLFISATLYFSVKYNETRSDRTLYLTAFIAGLGVFHQQTFIFVGLPLVIWMAKGASRKDILICAILFSLGILPYAYLPMAESSHPFMSWGESDTLKGFLIHFLRREYGTFQLGPSAWKTTSTWLDHFFGYFKSVPAGFLGGFFILALPGFLLSWRRYQWMPLSYFSYLFVFSLLTNSMLELPIHRAIEARFWQQPNLILYFWCGIGFAWFFSSVLESRNTVVIAVISLALAVGQNAIHFNESDQSRNHVVEDYGRSILEDLEPNSILIVTSDVAWNATQYLQLCENFRPDVRVVSQEMMTYVWMTDKMKSRYPDLVLPGSFYLPDKDSRKSFIARYDERYSSGGYSMLEFLNANKNAPIYLSYLFKEPGVLSQYELIPIGLYDRVVSLQDPARLDKSFWVSKSKQFWSHFDPGPAAHASPESWEHFIEQMIELYRVRRTLTASK